MNKEKISLKQQKLLLIVASVIIIGIFLWGATSYMNMVKEVKKLNEVKASLEYESKMFKIYEGYYNDCRDKLNQYEGVK